MKYTCAFFVVFLCCATTFAQKPFTEGVITYRISLKAAGQPEVSGKYIFTVKGMEIKKELSLNNGYTDVTLINTGTGAVRSLQSKNGKNYVIELAMSDLEKKQEKYMGFTLSNEQPAGKSIAGMQASKATINYRGMPSTDLYYTKDWAPTHPILYEHFPNAKFIVLSWAATDNNVAVSLNAEKVEPGPVENAVFKIPADYKLISYKEYKELSQK